MFTTNSSDNSRASYLDPLFLINSDISLVYIAKGDSIRSIFIENVNGTIIEFTYDAYCKFDKAQSEQSTLSFFLCPRPMDAVPVWRKSEFEAKSNRDERILEISKKFNFY